MRSDAAVSRPPLDTAALKAAIAGAGGSWRDVRVVEQTGSTNADLLTAAAAGDPEGLVLVAEAQSAGRGRLGRSWVSPPRAALTFSVLLRPGAVPPPRRAWLPLLAGVAVASSLRTTAAVDATLKWPNDVLSEGTSKLAGILAEQAQGAVVVGIGLNVSARRDELPPPAPAPLPPAPLPPTSLPPTSLALLGASCLDRHRLLAGMLAELERCYLAWSGHHGDAEACGLRAQYRRLSATLGRRVRVIMPGDRVVTGQAADIDPDGRLVVATSEGPVPVSAGDVIHVR